jgi:hypothetical protein
MTTTYRAIAEWSAHGWRVRIEGVGGLAGVQARDLADVEPKVRKLLWSYTGLNPADFKLDVEVRLPPAIQVHLDLAEELCEEATNEVESAIRELLEGGLSVADVGEVLSRRCRMPRPVSVTNREIVEHGLSRHPDALGLRWDDHGRFLTIICRYCVETIRRGYVDAPPDDENVLIYEGPLHCDRCNEEFVA